MGMVLSRPVLTANLPKGTEAALESESWGAQRGLRRQRSRRTRRGPRQWTSAGGAVAGEACRLGKVSDDE